MYDFFSGRHEADAPAPAPSAPPNLFGFRMAPVMPVVHAVNDRVRLTGMFVGVMRTVASRTFLVSPNGEVTGVAYTYR